jgi:histidine phosphotransferase ChpT
MAADLDIRVWQLLTARLCHELAGPLAAVANGVELMGDGDASFAADALLLVGTSAKTASARLQFYRFAYGALPGEGTSPAIGRNLVLKLFEGGNVHCDWPESEAARPMAWQRLACLALVLAAEALPRGGTVALRSKGAWPAVEADGETVRMLPEAQAALRSGTAIDNLTVRGVHAYLTARFAAELKLKLAPPRAEPRRLRIEFAAI